MKILIDTIDVKDPEVAYLIVRALENTNTEAGESKFEVIAKDEVSGRDPSRVLRILNIYKVENVPAETPKTGF